MYKRQVYHPGYAAKRMEIGAVVGATPADHVVRDCPDPGDIVTVSYTHLDVYKRQVLVGKEVESVEVFRVVLDKEVLCGVLDLSLIHI